MCRLRMLWSANEWRRPANVRMWIAQAISLVLLVAAGRSAGATPNGLTPTGRVFCVEVELHTNRYWRAKGVAEALSGRVASGVVERLERRGLGTWGRRRDLRADCASGVDLRITGAVSGTVDRASYIVQLRMSVEREPVLSSSLEVPTGSETPLLELPEVLAEQAASLLAQSEFAGLWSADVGVPPEAPKESDARPVIAIHDLGDPGEAMDPAARSQATEYLGARVAELLGFRVIPREEARRRIQRLKLDSYRPCADDACQIEIGRALSAKKSLSAKILKVGADCRLTATLYDLELEISEAAASAPTGCGMADVLSTLDHIVMRLEAKRTKDGKLDGEPGL